METELCILQNTLDFFLFPENVFLHLIITSKYKNLIMFQKVRTEQSNSP